VVDTDVIAAAVLGEPGKGEEASRLLAGKWELSAPAHWKAEFANVVWKAAQLRRMGPESIDNALSLAEALPIASADVSELWRGAVARAVSSDHPADDALFVELAVRLETWVASYDRQLRTRFRERVKLPGELLKSSQLPTGR
jgi:predicted nucleic acid-binding protein